ncbi:UNVERIFIED_CONTAM: hypothetical protein FKN15_023819 [Acipenser sinensis]
MQVTELACVKDEEVPQQECVPIKEEFIEQECVPIAEELPHENHVCTLEENNKLTSWDPTYVMILHLNVNWDLEVILQNKQH